MRLAAIDIGTNSTRLLVADVAEGRVDELFRRSIVTRLGDRVDVTGRLAEDARQRVFDVLAGYMDEYSEAGAERVGGVCTSAVRDAANGERFVAEVEERFGIALDLIEGDREAQLTFAGACSGDALGSERSVVVDIGGGSTEFIVGEDGELRFHVSTNIGAVRHSERFLHSDPPLSVELDDLLAAAGDEIQANVPAEWRRGIVHGVAVAGTPTVLASVDLALERFDPWKVHGHRISLESCERILGRLAALPLAERRAVTGLHPDRAPTIVAGAAILLATLRAFDLSSVTVSEHDILYGIALDLAARN